MEMIEGVGRRLGDKDGVLLSIGSASLNGREQNVLFRNDGDGRFTDVAYVNEAARIEDGRGLAVFDYDEDGRLDLALRNFKMPAVVLHNTGGAASSVGQPAANWVRFDLEGTHSNRDAVGAVVRIRAGEHAQMRFVTAGSGYLSGHSKRLHFGLGHAERIDSVEIEWPSGDRTQLEDLDANRAYHLVEGPTGHALAAP